MNKICKDCQARITLHKCGGKTGDFNFCYRNCGEFKSNELYPLKDIKDIRSLNELPKFINKEKPIKISKYISGTRLVSGFYNYDDVIVYIPIGYLVYDDKYEDEIKEEI